MATLQNAPLCLIIMDGWGIGDRGEGPRAQDPTFRLFDRRYGPDPMACDFVFVSAGLAPRVSQVQVDGATQASDHQPVLLQLG